MLIFVMSPFLNGFLQGLKKWDFQMLLFAFSVFLIIAPTLLYFHITDDGGKGFCNMLLAYCIGRYIGMYQDDFKKRARVYLGAGLLIISVETAINFFFGFVINVESGAWGNQFARDNSLFIVAGSILIFIAVMKMTDFSHCSQVIVKLASYVFPVYLSSGTFSTIIRRNLDITVYKHECYFPLLLIGFSITVILLSIITETARKKMLGRIETRALGSAENLIIELRNKQRKGQLHE